MTKIEITMLNNYANHGQDAEQSLAYALCGEIRQHDNVRFDRGSDIPEFHMSVKSAKASICHGGSLKATDFDGMVDEFFERVASEKFAYVAKNSIAYIMSKEMFKQFVKEFASIGRESKKNGGKQKLRLNSESKRMMAWLEEN